MIQSQNLFYWLCIISCSIIPLALIPEIRQPAPPLFKIMGGHFRAPVSGQQPLLVAICPHTSLNRGKVCKVPHMLSNKKLLLSNSAF